MGAHNRRNILGMAGAGLAGGAWPGLAGAAIAVTPDLVVVNAKVYTVDERAPRAQAFAVKDGRFLAVGSNDDVRGLAGPGTRVMDVQGATVVPGFIDTHCHPVGERLLYDVIVGHPFEVEFVTIDSIVAKLRERAAKTPPGAWVEGYFYDDTKVRDGREITAADLDRVSTQHPVMVVHRGGHTAYYNHKALEMAGITKATPNIQGGTYDKLPNGELSGRVTDTAKPTINKFGDRPQRTEAEKAERGRAGAAHMSKEFVRYGLTSVHHSGGSTARELEALQQIRANGDLLHRVSFELSEPMVESAIKEGIRTGLGDEWIKIGATNEYTADGSFSERTMAISTPYPGSNSPYQGNVTQTQEQLDAWALKVHRAGIQPNVHANGDVAIDMTLTAYERALKAHPVKNMRPKITHCTLINDDILRRMKALDVIPAVFTTYAYYNSDKFKFYGKGMMSRSMAFRSFLDNGIKATAGSDFSPGPFAPLMGMQGMVTRKGWNGEIWGANQKITVAEALRVMTLNGAYASFEENIKGSITPGKLADFVVLSEDPHTINPEKIKDIKIVRTVTGGRTVYEA
ncbi:amidohydrolase [Phenylobacterium sp.]|jgi:predicted amidohydrolase YtcJ|uniref:amidohydrolase n=1 Tax=Phenylobacterium sp. TaxID=1871053 RepID=UPI0037832166